MAEENANETITIKKETFWKYTTVILAVVLIVGAFVFFSKNDGGTGPTGQIVNIPNNNAPGGQQQILEIGSSPVKGSANAPVTLIEFSDYECPFCGRHFRQTYPLINENYIETGKIRFAFKDFPLNFHPNAQKAAEAAKSVREQLGDDGYWKMHNKLFENQQFLSVENYKKWAREIGVDGEKFDSALDSGKFANDVKNDMALGQKSGVSGTPAFFVNGKPIVGACPYSTFQQAIDAELAGKSWSVSNCQVSVS